MNRKDISINGAIVGAVAGLAAELTLQEITGHHFTHGLLELVGAAAGLWRLDRRLVEALQDSLVQVKKRDDEDYREVKRKIEELADDLPELKEILSNMLDAGIKAQNA
ncbi:MAG: hypothetical protein QME75_02665 [Deltaproteobacteria bacterium]|nr:hypothetical protein [Deltaproteobacteria bacterium]